MQNSRNISLNPYVDRRQRRLGFHATVILLLLAALWLCRTANAQTTYENYTFLTFAGPGSDGAGSSDGTGSTARFNQIGSIARDANGNFYVADSGNNAIRKITPAGQVTTLAGLAGFPGTNDGVGAAARFNGPFGIALDSSNNIYVTDTGNNTIRKITPSGVVTTFAGSPGTGSNTNGAANLARFNAPRGISFDSNNNLYVADSGNNEIRLITPAGAVSLFAGSKTRNSGTNNGTGPSALFDFPTGVAVGPDGNIYVADEGNHTIRRMTPNAVVSTLAGAGGISGSANGTNSTARFDDPINLTVDANTNVYVTDTFNHTIRQVTSDGVVTTPVGTPGTSGSLNATGQSALFNFPIGIAVDQNTNLFVAEFGNNDVREVNAALVVTTFTGVAGGSGTTDANGSAARFNFPSGIAFDPAQNAYVTDLGNNTIRKITPEADVSTFAGSAGNRGTNDGIGTAANFANPGGLTVDNNGNIFVADTQNETIRQITPLGSVTTLAGTPQLSGTNNATGTAAQFNGPNGVAADTNGNVFVADTQNDAIRQIAPGGVVTTFSGILGVAGTNDGPVGTAQFNIPNTLAFGAGGNLFVVDDVSSSIRKLAPDGSVTTFAGTPRSLGSTDGATAQFHLPWGIAFDANGNSYVTDTGNNTIRKITPAGVTTTIAGTPGQSGSLDGTGSDARFNEPEGIAVDNQGNVYIADAANHSIRKGYPALPDMPVVDNIGAAPGVTRHFSISNETTTTWSWSLIRQPANSSAQIVGANTDSPTFTPDVGSEDIYEVQFQGWDNSGHTTIRRITLYADATPPTVAITNPAPGIVASNGVFSVAGTAADNLGVSSVFVQLNGGAWTNATGTTNWAVNENLVPGANGDSTNIIRAYSQDFAGHVSPTNQVELPYILSDQLRVIIKGGGTLKPNLNGVFLRIGQTYSITVKAVSGSTFSNWTANLGPGTNSTTITFVMQSNLTLTANCIDHARPSVAITFPKPAKFFSAASMFVAGTAKDNDSITNVFYQLNGGAWTNATGTTNWFAQVNLIPGVNTVLVYSQDPSGNRSTTNRFTLNFLPTAIGDGNYAGLFFDTNNLTATNAGFFSATLAPAGAFTAKLLLGGGTVPFSGQFSNDGLFSNSIVAKSFNTPFTIQLTLDLTGAGTITGTIANSGWSVPLLANQDVFSVLRPPSQELQQFSLVIPGDEDSLTQPGGNSTGTITVDDVGNVTIIGSLADGSPASQKTFISKNGNWPFYISSSSGQGVTLGWLTFSPGQKGTLTGQVYWERLPQANAKLYPAGINFTNGIAVSSSYFNWFVHVPTLVVPNGGQIVLQQAGISPALTNYFTLNSNDGVSSTNKLKLTIARSTGAFKGSMVNPANNLSIPISGVILTNQNAGFGFFINNNQSGSVFIGTNSP
ncbi:MAG TPA: hypothetical protein VKV04_14890 [Verrucomicrobiae bacterium]|nr:hypothetical protein [Verrucomicrobiae bacterium]